MTEPDVALTDYAIALECAVIAFWLLRTRKSGERLSLWFMVFFLATALAALAGGTVHGFFSAQGSLGYRVLWPLGLIMIGLAALAFTNVGTAISSGPIALAVSRAALVLFLLYCVFVLFFDERFVVAIVAYLPAVLFLGWVFLEQYRRTRRRAFAWGLAGIGVTLLAAAIQQARITIDPRYFNHNALYHTLQAAGLFMIFVTARDLSRRS
ncbi:MAG TPA: hypothetical protein VF532_02260 [Candidatus Angelobacter sp.]